MTIPRKYIRGPLPGTGTHTVVNTVHNHGPLTMADGIAIHGNFGLYPTKIRKIYNSAVSCGWLDECSGKYSLTPAMLELLERWNAQPLPPKVQTGQTPGRYVPTFKPLKMMPVPLIRPDAQPLREISFIAGTAGYFTPNRD